MIDKWVVSLRIVRAPFLVSFQQKSMTVALSSATKRNTLFFPSLSALCSCFLGHIPVTTRRQHCLQVNEKCIHHEPKKAQSTKKLRTRSNRPVSPESSVSEVFQTKALCVEIPSSICEQAWSLLRCCIIHHTVQSAVAGRHIGAHNCTTQITRVSMGV